MIISAQRTNDDTGQKEYVSGQFVRLSYQKFGELRQELARFEGFELREMKGYAGDKSWDEVETALKPILSGADDNTTLTPMECFAVYPRLEHVLGRLRADGGASDAILDIGDRIVGVMKACAQNGWELVFS